MIDLLKKYADQILLMAIGFLSSVIFIGIVLGMTGCSQVESIKKPVDYDCACFESTTMYASVNHESH